MPLTDFLKHFLQKLPENIQYLGTDVAPLMGPNWQQAIQAEQQRQMQMGAAQQQQANWEKQFGAQEQQRQQQNQFQQGQLTLEAIRNGLIPQGAQPQRTPGGPGLNGGGANPSFGAGGGAGAAPSPQGPDPSNMSSIAPFAAMFGMQQGGGQGVNQPNNVPSGATTPGNRMPGMGGDSGGGGGATVPSAFNIPGINSPMIPRPEMMIPVPAELQKEGFPATMKESDFKQVQQYIDTRERLSALTSKAKPVGKKTDEQYSSELAAQKVMAGINPNWKPDPDQDPIDQLPSLDAKLAALEESQRLRGNDPTDKVAQRKLEERRLDYQMKDLQDKEQDWNTNHSPQVLAGMAESVRRNPDSFFDIDSKNRDEVGREFTRQTGMPPPSKIDTPTKTNENTAMKVQGFINNIQESLAANPNLLSKLGPISGRISSAELEAGNIPNFTKQEKEAFGQLYGNIKNMNYSEAKTLLQGRPAAKFLNDLMGAYVSVSKVPELVNGALKASQDVVDDARQTGQIARFGSLPKWTAAELGSKFRAGQHVYHNGVRKTVLGFDANGKVQLFP